MYDGQCDEKRVSTLQKISFDVRYMMYRYFGWVLSCAIHCVHKCISKFASEAHGVRFGTGEKGSAISPSWPRLCRDHQLSDRSSLWQGVTANQALSLRQREILAVFYRWSPR